MFGFDFGYYHFKVWVQMLNYFGPLELAFVIVFSQLHLMEVCLTTGSFKQNIIFCSSLSILICTNWLRVGLSSFFVL